MLTQFFCLSCWPIAFPIVSQPFWIFMFFFLQNSSLLFSITRSSSFSVIHVSVNIKNNAEKDTTLLMFFLSKSPDGHTIFFQIKPWVAFGLPYLLIELFYIGIPVVRTVGRCTVTWLPNFLVWVAEEEWTSSHNALRFKVKYIKIFVTSSFGSEAWTSQSNMANCVVRNSRLITDRRRFKGRLVYSSFRSEMH